MSDLISRQAAIRIASGYCHPANIAEELAKLPSAEPEIIRCKDCRHYLNSNEKCALIDTRLNFYATEKRWNGDSFCSWAERRTE